MMATTLPADASSGPTTISFLQDLDNCGVVATATTPRKVIEFVVDHPTDRAPAVIPEGYRPISEVVAEHEKDPRKKAALERARKWLREAAYGDEPLTIRTLRLEKGLSQQSLAELVGTRQPYIARIEQGAQHHNLTLNTCRRLAHALGVDLNTIDQALRNQAAGTGGA